MNGRLPVRSEAAFQRRRGTLNQTLSPPLPGVAREFAALLDVTYGGRAVRARREIVSEGKRCTAIYLVTEGIAIRYRILRDGQRHILNLILPHSSRRIHRHGQLLLRDCPLPDKDA